MTTFLIIMGIIFTLWLLIGLGFLAMSKLIQDDDEPSILVYDVLTICAGPVNWWLLKIDPDEL